MTHRFSFYGDIRQCWKVFYSEYHRLSEVLGRPPFEFETPKHATINEYIPKDGDEIIVNFWDTDHKHTLLAVEAEIVPDEDRQYNIFVHPQGNSFEEPFKSALSIWKEVKNTMQARGYLTDPKTAPQKPAMPQKPSPGSKLDVWFDWYHDMHDSGHICTLEDIASETGYSPKTLKRKHSLYLNEKGLGKTTKKTRPKVTSK